MQSAKITTRLNIADYAVLARCRGALRDAPRGSADIESVGQAAPTSISRSPSFAIYILKPRNLNALAMTHKELKVMAALAMIGLNSSPKMG